MSDQNIPGDLKETIDLMEGLLVDLKKPERELDEDTFKRLFLPYLTTTDKEVDLRAWVAVAGSPTGRVSVYRMNAGKKEELFIVPPLINLNGFTKSRYSHQDSIYERVQNAMRRIRNAPMQAKKIYDEEIHSADVNGIKFPFDDLMQWISILDRYGINIGISTKEKGLPNGNKNEIRTEGYEEL